MTTTALSTPQTLLDGPLGAVLLTASANFALVEHPIAPRTLEVISPGGFEDYFAELAPLLHPKRDFEGLARLQAKYGLEMDFSSIERLSREHGLGTP